MTPKVHSIQGVWCPDVLNFLLFVVCLFEQYLQPVLDVTFDMLDHHFNHCSIDLTKFFDSDITKTTCPLTLHFGFQVWISFQHTTMTSYLSLSSWYQKQMLKKKLRCSEYAFLCCCTSLEPKSFRNNILSIIWMHSDNILLFVETLIQSALIIRHCIDNILRNKHTAGHLVFCFIVILNHWNGTCKTQLINYLSDADYKRNTEQFINSKRELTFNI